MAVDSDIQQRQNAPDARADTILSILNSIFVSVELVCLADGKAFTNLANPHRAKDSFYRPLMCIQEIFICLVEDLDRWARPAKFLDYKSASLTRLSQSRNIPDHEKMEKLYRTLDKIGRIDHNYVAVFTRFADDFDVIRQEIKKLINLLKDIIHDGNSLDPKNVAPGTPNSLRDITNSQPHPRHSRELPRTCYDLDSDDLLSHHLTATALLTPPSESGLTPHWKHLLSDWRPIEDLYVGQAELNVFREALHHAKKCATAARATQEVASGLATLAEERQGEWEEWWETWHRWDNDKKRREREDEEEY